MLKMTTPNVRHHLKVLQSDGLVRVSGKTSKSGKGRPVQLYNLADELRGNNLSALASVVLHIWQRNQTAAGQAERMRELGRTMKETLGEISLGEPTARQLALLVSKLNEHFYHAHWEAGAEGPRIVFERCPYAAIIREHPELCMMDRAILESSARVQASQHAKIGEKGSTACLFVLR
jgi:predicted ArsR family transcriptional regulator